MGEANLFTNLGGEQYAHFAESGGYAVSILGITNALVPYFRTLDHTPNILEVGAGRGRSTKALGEALSLNNINAEIIATEPDRRLLKFAANVHPRSVNPAEALPFKKECFDAVVGSQMVHWIVPGNVSLFFSEAKRVLRPGGMLVLASSGIVDLEEVNAHHFTRHPFVSEHFFPALKKFLIARGYWDDENKTFGTRDPRLNPRYDNYTLQAYRDLLRKNGFRDISTPIYMFPFSTKELTARLTDLAPLQMHFFHGDLAKKIPDDKMVKLAEEAFTQARSEAPELFRFFDEQSLEVTLGAKEGTFGDPLPIISAIKGA